MNKNKIKSIDLEEASGLAGSFRVNKENLNKVKSRIEDLERLESLLEGAITAAENNNKSELIPKLQEELDAVEEALAELERIQEEILNDEYENEPENKGEEEGKKEGKEEGKKGNRRGKGGEEGEEESEEEGEEGEEKEGKEGKGGNGKSGKGKDDGELGNVSRNEPEKQQSMIPKPQAFQNEPDGPGQGPGKGQNGQGNEPGQQQGPNGEQKPGEQYPGQEGGQEGQEGGQEGQKPGSQNPGQQNNPNNQQNNQNSQNQQNNKNNQDNEQQNSSKASNPFEPTPGNYISGTGKMTPEEIAEYLNSLPTEAKAAAVNGIKNILDKKDTNESFKRTKALTEDCYADIYNVRGSNSFTSSEDSFNDYYNKISGLVNDAYDGRSTLVDDPSMNIKRIDDWLHSPEDLQDITQELTGDAADEIRKRNETRKQELQKFAGYPPLSSFWVDFERAINDQIITFKEEEKSWFTFNNVADEDGILDKGTKHVDKEKIDMPTIDFFFDMSGSWDDDEEAKDLGKRILNTFIDEEEQGHIILRPWYFSGDDSHGYCVITDNINDGRLGGYTDCWNSIIKKIKEVGAKNVVIMTDSDMPRQITRAMDGGWLPGEVWYLYRKDGYDSRYRTMMSQHLRGRQGTSEYGFETNRGNN